MLVSIGVALIQKSCSSWVYFGLALGLLEDPSGQL